MTLLFANLPRQEITTLRTQHRSHLRCLFKFGQKRGCQATPAMVQTAPSTPTSHIPVARKHKREIKVRSFCLWLMPYGLHLESCQTIAQDVPFSPYVPKKESGHGAQAIEIQSSINRPWHRFQTPAFRHTLLLLAFLLARECSHLIAKNIDRSSVSILAHPRALSKSYHSIRPSK